MDPAFQQYIEGLHPSFERMVSMPPVSISSLPKTPPRQCIYLFSEGETRGLLNPGVATGHSLARLFAD
jgi:hypothetical protein